MNPESPESRELAPRSPDLPALPQTLDATRRQLGPTLQIARDHAAEMTQEEQRLEAERKRTRDLAKHDTVASAPSEVAVVPMPAPHIDIAPRESVGKGVVTAGLGTAGAVAAGGFLAGEALKTATTGIASAGQSAILFGPTAALGATGYFVGKKIGHPVAGALAGAGLGTAGTLAYLPIQGAATNAMAWFGANTAANTALAGTLGSAVSVGSSVLGAGALAAAGGAFYGLGRWHGKVWGSKPAGILKTMARGVAAPLSVPLGYLMQKS